MHSGSPNPIYVFKRFFYWSDNVNGNGAKPIKKFKIPVSLLISAHRLNLIC